MWKGLVQGCAVHIRVKGLGTGVCTPSCEGAWHMGCVVQCTHLSVLRGLVEGCRLLSWLCCFHAAADTVVYLGCYGYCWPGMPHKELMPFSQRSVVPFIYT